MTTIKAFIVSGAAALVINAFIESAKPEPTAQQICETTQKCEVITK